MKSSSTSVTKVIRVLIADDHPVVREGLVTILKSEKDIKVVAEAADAKETCELYNQFRNIEGDGFVASYLIVGPTPIGRKKAFCCSKELSPTTRPVWIRRERESRYADRCLRSRF